MPGSSLARKAPMPNLFLSGTMPSARAKKIPSMNEVWKAYQLPADLIDEGQANVEDDKVDIREVGRGPIHIPGLGRLNRLWAQWYAFMHADGRHAQLKRLLKYWISDTPVIHAPGEGLAIVVAHVIELERFCSVLFDLAFHQVKSLFALQG